MPRAPEHIVITGANRGIGQALADHYRAGGQHVSATARRPSDDLLPLDVSDPRSCAALAARLAGQAVDLLICNAGAYPDGDQMLDAGYPAEMWAKTFATNVTGVFLTVQALLPHLRAAGAARIAILSSEMASHTFAPGGSYIYRASKAAVLNLGRNLATDLRESGIAVGIYDPGWVRTDMGGPEAELSLQESGAGLAQRFAALSLATTGCFLTWDGRAHPY